MPSGFFKVIVLGNENVDIEQRKIKFLSVKWNELKKSEQICTEDCHRIT